MHDSGSPGAETRVDDEFLLEVAATEARRATGHGDQSVGAVVAHRGRIVAARGDEVVTLRDPTAHAAVLAIRDAAAALGSWRLLDCVLAVTLEPCAMCTGAALLARVPRLVIGTRDPLVGACGSLLDLSSDARLNHAIEVVVSDARPEPDDQRFRVQSRAR